MGDVNKITANNMNTNNDEDASKDHQSFTLNHAHNQKEYKQNDQNITFFVQP